MVKGVKMPNRVRVAKDANSEDSTGTSTLPQQPQDESPPEIDPIAKVRTKFIITIVNISF